MLGKKNNNSQYSDEENPYWVSFSDIMSGLLIVFILAVIILLMELEQQRAEVFEAKEVRELVLQEISDELKRKGIKVEITDNKTVLRIPESVLSFRQASAEIPKNERMRKNVIEIGKALEAALEKKEGNKHRYEYFDTIFVEGHTDHIPYVKPEIKNNWGLSALRAISVWEYWRQKLPVENDLDRFRNHRGIKLFSVSGYAETRPAFEGAVTRDQLRMNRRIDIRFTVREPEDVIHNLEGAIDEVTRTSN